jgi:hypothetical protein
MKLLLATLVALLAAVPALAAGGATGPAGIGLLAIVFLGIMALIVLSQIVPAVFLLVGMIKGVMAKPAHAPHSGQHIG